jgi:imidazolonepropionase-like amidohydrolase/phosphohistidine phosphatase SixA
MLRIAFVLLLLLLGTGGSASPPLQSGIAIRGANVLPMTGKERLLDQTVLISGDRIMKIGPRRSVRVPAGYQIIEAGGQTLMPGLVDMHVHLPSETGKPGDAAQRALAVMLGHGVTTARGMAGSPNNLLVRSAIERGEVAGPRFYAAAPGISVANTKSVDEARAAVAAAKAAGYDLIKSHHLTDVAIWQAVQDEARRLGIATAGHVTNEITVARAAAAGQQIEHLDGSMIELMRAGSAEKGMQFGQLPPPPVLRAAARAAPREVEALATSLARAKSYQVPTLALFEKLAAVEVPTAQRMAAPEMRFIPDTTLGQWAKQHAQFVGDGLTAADGALLRDVRRRLVAAFHKAGVPIMAGSDTAQLFHIWGPGLIEEIKALAAAGLTPMAALRTATVVPRDYFRSLPNGGSASGWKADFGTVEPGARADLILLGQDPSKNVSALRTLKTVIARGVVHDRAALDSMLAKAAADAKAAKPQQQQASLAFPGSVYVMRHLQKGEGEDPPLSAEGAENARRLPALFAADKPAAIYVSPTRRARETAAPLAAALGIAPKSYDPANPAALIQAVSSEKGTVLIVGHSNTVPDIVERLGGARPAALSDSDYGDIWQVSGPARIVSKKRVRGTE